MPKITGRKEASDRIRGMSAQEKVELIGKALFAGGEAIKAEAAHSITEGAVSGAKHVPSKPGEPPNEDTGFLRAGLTVEQVAPLRVHVINGIPYARDLEFGTSKMAARPFMGPAARKMKPEVVATVKRAMKIATRKR